MYLSINGAVDVGGPPAIRYDIWRTRQPCTASGELQVKGGEWGEERAARELNPANQKKSVNTDIQQLGFAGGHPPNY